MLPASPSPKAGRNAQNIRGPSRGDRRCWIAKDTKPTATAAVKPNMVLTNAVEGSSLTIRVDDGGDSDDEAGSLSNRDDTTGRFPTNSRRPVIV